MPTVFVTGATGVLGRATLPRLIAAGYSLRALSRSSRNDAVIRELGAIPVRGDLFDSATLREAIGGSEAILHLATRIPPTPQIRHRQAWRENDRIRAAGAHALVDAALNSGVTVFVYPSFAFVYPDSGDAWIDAATTPTAPADMMRSTIAAEEEVARFAAAGGEQVRRGVSLRLAALYGPDLPSAQEQIAMARRGLTAFGARPDGFTPMLWIDDAASALVAALDGAPSGVYDVVDDEPLRQRDLKPAPTAFTPLMAHRQNGRRSRGIGQSQPAHLECSLQAGVRLEPGGPQRPRRHAPSGRQRSRGHSSPRTADRPGRTLAALRLHARRRRMAAVRPPLVL
jgi:nucleoside-diphosphate-sugar epimerase